MCLSSQWENFQLSGSLIRSILEGLNVFGPGFGGGERRIIHAKTFSDEEVPILGAAATCQTH